jgi:hypothetical protein
MMLQLHPMLPVDTCKGAGFAFVLIDYGQEHDTLYKTIITATGEIWDLPQSQVRGVKNISMGRGSILAPSK